MAYILIYVDVQESELQAQLIHAYIDIHIHMVVERGRWKRIKKAHPASNSGGVFGCGMVKRLAISAPGRAFGVAASEATASSPGG